mgnify:CR=1 FL=1|uniref:Uncharacterized protein n=1 Tax=Myoviridae sp. ctbEa13 TaxID=2825136 RepID=A0A8S5VBC6_9CAUD|nr:MAG TPA: Protein of unknown function (DUF3383) [Myoviridae sp. ctbEa13]
MALMMQDLRQFVDINIVPHATANTKGTRNAVLFTYEGTANTTLIINNLEDIETKLKDMTNTAKYATIFVNNGGTNLKVICGKSKIETTTIEALDLSDVIVTYCGTTPSTSQNALFLVAGQYNADANNYGIYEKIFLTASTRTNQNDMLIKNYAHKYSKVIGAEMTMAAYLSKIDVYSIDSVKDYAFTKENIDAENVYNMFQQSLKNLNVDVNLANAVRNIGGNCTDGTDLVNSYVRIVLHQTLTDKLIELLTQKIRGTAGVSKIYSAISKELQNYLTCGYLTTDKIWTDDDYKVTVGDQTYTIIEKGTALQNGYLIKILPMSSLTDAQKAKHSAPYIYVVIADQYGIRFITVNGEVI